MLHPDGVWDIALQPGTNRQVFALACNDGIIRLFDNRTSVTGIILKIYNIHRILILDSNFYFH